MTHYEMLLDECAAAGLQVVEVPLTKAKGFIHGRMIGIDPTLSDAQKAAILTEELAHYEVNVGNITDQSNTKNRKQEHKARVKVYRRLVSPIALVNAYRSGARCIEDFTDFLGISVELLAEALQYYNCALGPQIIGNYLITFQPFNITHA